VVDVLRSIAERLGASLAQLALAWVLRLEGVTGAIAGSRSPEHARENASAWTVQLSADDLREIDSILQDRGELADP